MDIEREIVFASDLTLCPDCGEPFCETHNQHYSDCPCLGPSNAEDEGFELVEKDGKMYALKYQKER